MRRRTRVERRRRGATRSSSTETVTSRGWGKNGLRRVAADADDLHLVAQRELAREVHRRADGAAERVGVVEEDPDRARLAAAGRGGREPADRGERRAVQRDRRGPEEAPAAGDADGAAGIGGLHEACHDRAGAAGQRRRADLPRRGLPGGVPRVAARADVRRPRGRDGRRRLARRRPRRSRRGSRRRIARFVLRAPGERGPRGGAQRGRGRARAASCSCSSTPTTGCRREAIAHLVRSLDRTGSDFATGNIHRFDIHRAVAGGLPQAHVLAAAAAHARHALPLAAARTGWRRTSSGAARSGTSTGSRSRSASSTRTSPS